MSQEASRRPRKPLPANLAWAAALVVMLAVGYVLSYPAAMKLKPAGHIPGYQPVEWLIDQTALGEPILRWSKSCLGHDAARHAKVYRQDVRFQERAGRGAGRHLPTTLNISGPLLNPPGQPD